MTESKLPIARPKKMFENLDYEFLIRIFKQFDLERKTIEQNNNEMVQEIQKHYPFRIDSIDASFHSTTDEICKIQNENWLGINCGMLYSVFVKNEELTIQLAMYA